MLNRAIDLIENQEPRLFYILQPDDNFPERNLYKIGEAKGGDEAAFNQRVNRINSGDRPVYFACNNWPQGIWNPVRVWVSATFGGAKEMEALVRIRLVELGHQRIGRDYFVGNVDQAVELAQVFVDAYSLLNIDNQGYRNFRFSLLI